MNGNSDIPQLTEGAIQRILNGETVEKPVLQVLAYKKIDADGRSQARVRFIMSDGLITYQCCIMVGDALIRRVEKGEFERFTIIRLDEYEWNNIKDNKVLLMKQPTVLKAGGVVNKKIGNPQNPSNQNGANLKNGVTASVPVKRPVGQGSSDDAASKPKQRVSHINIVPIHAVNQFQRGLSVKGRVTSKSNMRTWNNEKGSGCLFSFDLQDETGEIRTTAFKDKAEQIFPKIEIGKVYIIYRPQVKNANKRFSQLPHDFELSLSDESDVLDGDENDSTCPQMQYNFVPLAELQRAEADSFVDIAAIVHRASDVATLIQKTTQKELRKREITLVDDTCVEISLTIWGKDAEDFAGEVGTPVIIKKAKVSNYGGKSLSASTGFSLQLNPNHEKARELKEWYDRTKDEIQVVSLTTGANNLRETSVKFLCQVMHDAKTKPDPVFLTSRITVVSTLKTSSYEACPGEKCRKRVIDMNNGSYRCEKCNKDYDRCLKRYIQTVVVGDATGELYVSMFHEDFLKLVEATESELAELNADQLHDRVAQSGGKQYMFKMKVFRDMYNDQMRTKANVMDIKPVEPAVQCKRLMATFRALIAP